MGYNVPCETMGIRQTPSNEFISGSDSRPNNPAAIFSSKMLDQVVAYQHTIFRLGLDTPPRCRRRWLICFNHQGSHDIVDHIPSANTTKNTPETMAKTRFADGSNINPRIKYQLSSLIYCASQKRWFIPNQCRKKTTGSPNDLRVYEPHTWRIIILTLWYCLVSISLVDNHFPN